MGFSERFDWRSPPHLQGGHRRAYLLLAVGGGLLAVAPLLPWMQVALLGNVNLFRLHTLAHTFGYLPGAMVIAGVATLLGAYLGAGVRYLAWISVVVVVAVVTAGAGDLWDLYRLVHHSNGFLVLGIGADVAIAALACLGAGAVSALRQPAHAAGAAGAVGAPRGARAPRTPRQRRVVAEPPSDRSPGWKADPWGVAGAQRYWTGDAWTSDTVHRRR